MAAAAATEGGLQICSPHLPGEARNGTRDFLNVHIASNSFSSPLPKSLQCFLGSLKLKIFDDLRRSLHPFTSLQKLWSTINDNVVPNSSYSLQLKVLKYEKLFLKSTLNFPCCSSLFILPTESSALQNLFIYLKTVQFFFTQLTTTPSARQVAFSRLINLAVLCWNPLQLFQILLEVQHLNPKIFLQLNLA